MLSIWLLGRPIMARAYHPLFRRSRLSGNGCLPVVLAVQTHVCGYPLTSNCSLAACMHTYFYLPGKCQMEVLTNNCRLPTKTI
ncbi:hypothetical protein F4780DRAFT_752422, partial [Xylariomycetidae sp. FL0641]